MATPAELLAAARPSSIAGALPLPRRVRSFPSPVDWRNEVLYFLLVDRFSDGRDGARPLLDRANAAAQRGAEWSWQAWFDSGSDQFQGGNLRGVISRLDYLEGLGVTAIWLSPVFKQRRHLRTYHGYGIQDFLDVDPRFGTRADLVELVAQAHGRGIRVILDVIFNHSGSNWIYPDGQHAPPYTGGSYELGAWLDASGNPVDAIAGPDDGVWPEELQRATHYTRAGRGDLGAGHIDDPNAEHKRTDFETLRDFALGNPGVLNDLAWVYKYWIALTDCDGFRIDTLKHVPFEEGRNFCGAIKELAANLGKDDFFLVGEVAGGDFGQDRYLDVLDRNLNAALDIGEARLAITSVAKGLGDPAGFFDGFDPGNAVFGSHRNIGNRHVSILDDHDHVFGTKLRFSVDAPNDHQAAAATALQLFTLGIPCIYYGTEQALSGPEPAAERQWLPRWGSHDAYLREAMFGPERGFPAFGAPGRHVFDPDHPVYTRIAKMARLRKDFPVLRHGRQYRRQISTNGTFQFRGSDQLVAWSRILDDEEALIVVNTTGAATRSARIVVDASLNRTGSSFIVVLHTGDAAQEGTSREVRESGGPHFVDVRDVGASEVVVLVNRSSSRERRGASGGRGHGP
ncbi:MAG TPA: alpha-amylase family glycosyl hydrolase, partial [Thermoanaerobaculia bacterium]|nr:alpha-amylase family glycosyl hydrolase [Thermoanaerobaculia bacterium]